MRGFLFAVYFSAQIRCASSNRTPSCLSTTQALSLRPFTLLDDLIIMLKVRIIAALIAIVLTALTIYIAPYVINFYQNWSAGLSPQRRQWFNWSQAGIGALIAVYGFWLWKKKKS